MFVKKFTAAVAALMLTASPVIAQSTAAIPAPQTETVSGANNLNGAPEALGILVGVTIIGLILFILVQSGDEDDDDFEPVSP